MSAEGEKVENTPVENTPTQETPAENPSPKNQPVENPPENEVAPKEESNKNPNEDEKQNTASEQKDDEKEQKDDESESSSDSSSNAEMTALGEYCPFIADVPISSYADPFPIPNPDTRSDEEIERVKKSLKKALKNKKFDPPIPLADFCLIAKDRWDQEEDDSEASIGLCLLI
ncbi:hypothetical protein TRFO_02947 [Tritrichomonas foetus]|uniref:Uncharacterized protein n=1 Tax=Tritrichomonas foetus TaxID=1144522 RepID=A0A1J4KTW7_9EUKA|nr:hypothetical protein TRFO_02947 [Tritrichomonas foetus]|eukprot:OHT14707.1 hypothetical protein TRFO_02947 [Tritrichomonas foetus]